jgi:HK97 family phage major capsid protein
MRQQAATQLAEATRLDALANSANRLLTEEERGAYDLAIAENRRLLEAAQRREELDTANPQEVDDGLNEQETRQASRAPNVLRHYRRGDNEARAVAAYLRRGDAGGLLQLRASNNVPMTEGVAANGGYAVPVDHYTQIIAKRNEALLAPKLGCRRIPGKGTTVNVTTETGTNNAAILTAESAAYDRDAPGLGQVQMTLVKYTKKIDVTEELEEDNDVNLLSFIENYVGSAFAQTQNAALVAAAIATAAPVGGTVTALAGSGAAALPSDITTLVYSLKDEYADGAKFLMKKATEGLYRALTGSGFQFAPTPGAAQGEFWGYPKYNSSFVASLGLSAKCLLFGNWDYMGWREGAGLEMLRDPYSQEGRILLKYSQRFVYACLLPEAILVGQKAAS